MKTKNLIPIFLSLILILTACGGSASEESAPQTGDAVQERLPLETTLMIGTVKLDETEHAIDSAQAAELLPLWKALKSLSESETAASAETEAIINQIEKTMTSEQMETITAMELSTEDMAAVQEQLGIEDMSPEMQATMQAAQESGEMPAGGPGGDKPAGMGAGGGKNSGGGTEIDPSARETARAERGFNRGGMRVNMALLDGIIEFLATKTQ